MCFEGSALALGAPFAVVHNIKIVESVVLAFELLDIVVRRYCI
jgi:hypothetical protein